VTGLLHYADDVLRRRPWTTQSARTGAALKWLIALIVAFGMAYGAVMGSFAGVRDGHLLQIFYSAVKVPLLLVATSLIALPNFFVLNTLFGLRRDFAQAVRALAATQAGLAVVLASLAPLTLVWYATSADYNSALRFNAVMFAVASFGAQILLRGYYQPLIRRNPRHRLMLWLWLTIYVFVGIQMGWVLRPFIGDPGAPVQFFRAEAWSNAYVVVFKLITSLVVR
jgi:hypothetical protein